MLLIRVTESAGTYTVAAGGADVTLTDNGVGDISVNFREPFAQVPFICATASQIGRNVGFSTNTTSVCRVLIQDLATPTAAEGGFHLVVIGLDSAEIV